MPKRQPETQKWWRWSEYEVTDGSIRPSAGATLDRYAPWANYTWAAEHPARDRKAPYQRLVDVLATIEAEESSDNLGPAGEEALLGWCKEYGLLGILPQHTQMVMLHPRLARPDSDLEAALRKSSPEEFDDDDEPWPTQPVRCSYLRIGAGWQLLVHAEVGSGTMTFSHSLSSDPLVTNQEADPPDFGLVDCGPLPHDEDLIGWPSSGVLSTEGWELGCGILPLESGWSTYFPQRGVDDPVLPPLSQEFWQHYAEPIFEFMAGARVIRAAMETFAPQEPSNRRTRNPADGTSRAVNRMEGRQSLYALLATVSPIVVQRAGAFEQSWEAPSLIGMFAAMIMQDLLGGRTFRWCSVCGGVFTSGAHAAAYCSNTCRWRHNKRVARKKEARTKKGKRRAERVMKERK